MINKNHHRLQDERTGVKEILTESFSSAQWSQLVQRSNMSSIKGVKTQSLPEKLWLLG